MKQLLVLLSLLYISNCMFSQKTSIKVPDSLKNKSYNHLDDKMYSFRKDSSKAAPYLNTYLYKALKEKNWEEVVYAYQNILHQSPEKIRIIYADSMVYAAKKSTDNALIGSAYLSKGIVYYGQKKYESAFDNYITANSYISLTDDQYQHNKVKYHMAQVKYLLGFYDEAISLFQDCLEYYIKEDTRAYLNCLHSLGVLNNKIGNYGLCSEINKKGISESERLKNLEMIPYFKHSEGINLYFKKNYGSAIVKIESSLDSIRENKDFANEAVGNFYIGKSYWALNKKEKALLYFLKVDKTFTEKNYMRPDLREVYELLINYYKSKNDQKSQLLYIDQLLKADSLLNETNKYLITKIHKQYDTKELLVEREKIHKQLKREKYYDVILITIVLILFTFSVFLTYRYHKNKKFYKKKFDEVMQSPASLDKPILKLKKEKAEILDIPEETISFVLKELEKFESEKKFLAKDVRLTTVAGMLHTNSKYLYKIISLYKDKRFVEYINDLKIDFIIALLKENKLARNYTNTALAMEAGFSSTQQFVNAFKSRTGMPVNFFIEEINKRLNSL